MLSHVTLSGVSRGHVHKDQEIRMSGSELGMYYDSAMEIKIHDFFDLKVICK